LRVPTSYKLDTNNKHDGKPVRIYGEISQKIACREKQVRCGFGAIIENCADTHEEDKDKRQAA
jgi:hypothetical protein